MRVLAIETSCDETGLALVEGQGQGRTLTQGSQGPTFGFRVLKSALLSQAALHAPYGGVYPNLAKREHQKNLPTLWQEFAGEKFDALCVTQGPGLEPALWQGVEFAKKIAAERNLPLFGVNHMEGHLISSLAQSKGQTLDQNSQGLVFELKGVTMPVLGLLISGGHTEFLLMKDWFIYEVIGKTLDDAVGEAFDKVARMLGLPYPGGPEISRLASAHRAKQKSQEKSLAREDGRSEDFSNGFSAKLPRPMLNSGTCDVSFSGLKTAALYALRKLEQSRSDLSTGLPKVGPLTPEETAAFAAEFEEAVADVFVAKARQALIATGAQIFVIGGGVAANTYIRERLGQLLLDEFPEVEYRLPQLSITGDNAIMIAEAALTHLLTGDWTQPPQEIKASGNLSIAQKVL